VTAHDVDRAVARIAADQAGVFSRRQMLQHGGTRDIVRRRLGSGSWLLCADGVYRLREIPVSWRSELWVATLAPGCEAVVSHEAAAVLHHIATFRGEPVVVTVPHATTRLDHVAVVHQSRRLYPEHVTRVDGLAVTTAARTLIDLAALHRRARLEVALDNCLAAKEVTLDGVCVTFDDLACRGRKGTKLMRSLLAERAPGYVAPGNEFESLFLRLVRRGGLPRPVLQFPHPSPIMDGKFVDAAYPELRILIELDSRRWHDRSRDHERDRERDISAQLVGYRPYRFTYKHVTKQGDWVLDVLREARRQAA